MGIEPQQILPFIDRAFDGMLRCVEQLGDERINEKPDLPGANSPFAIVYHCIQLTDWWVGTMCMGRAMDRDRDAEFVARGTVAELATGIAAMRSQVDLDISRLEPGLALQQPDLLPPDSKTRDWTRGEALVHTYEELAQHLGHLEITRDVLLSR